MRIVMMGTGPFAVPTFRWLLQSEHDVPALFTRPERPSRGRQKQQVGPMREVGQQHDIAIFEPEDVNAPAAVSQLAELRPELLVVCDYGQILARATLNCAKLGGINLHGSLLPQYRGAAPVHWAIFHGEQATGVTVIHMSPKLDAGPCLSIRETEIGYDETTVELEPRLAELGVGAVRDSLGMLSAWDGESSLGARQDPAQATKAPRLKKSDGEVDWTRSAADIRNQVRAFKPWPGTFTHLSREGGEPLRLILDWVSVADCDAPTGEPGSIVLCEKEKLVVCTGDGVLSIDRIQPAGKRAMAIDEFLCGHSLRVGQTLGPAETS